MCDGRVIECLLIQASSAVDKLCPKIVTIRALQLFPFKSSDDKKSRQVMLQYDRRPPYTKHAITNETFNYCLTSVEPIMERT